MYKKNAGIMILCSFLYLSCFLCVQEIDVARLCSEPVQKLKLELQELEEKSRDREESLYSGEEGGGLGIAGTTVSGQRVVDYSLLEQTYIYNLSDEELEILLRIVEAEAGSEDEDGKLLVANVVLNRVNSDDFPDTVSEVVFQSSKGVTQFSPVASGRFYKVVISDETISAVGRALMGEDISQGALFFAARKYADRKKMKWFDEKLTYLFAHGGHEFFR